MLKRLRAFRLSLLCFIAALAMGLFFSHPFPGGADQGLKITGGLIEREVSPGEAFSHTFVVSNHPTASAFSVRIEARGFGQGFDGSYIPLEGAKDAHPYSAREFITAIEPSTFTLGPGQSQEVQITVGVPLQPLESARYALIYVHTDELSTGPGSAIVLAATVPVVLTPRGLKVAETGLITDLAVGQVQSGQPIEVSTVFENTGNHHYRAYNEVTLSDAFGREVGSAFTAPTPSSILPGFAYRFAPAIVPRQELPSGTYRIESRVFHEDGTLLASQHTDFSITYPWEIFPPRIIPESIEIFTLNDEIPPEINAAGRSSLRIIFRDTGKVTGRVITARYDGEPQVSVPFSALEGQGGMGSQGIQFSAIHTEGFSRGTAEVQFLYADEVIRQYDESSLFIGFWDGSRWQRFENVRVFTGARYVSGEVPVGRLVGVPVGLGGKRLSPVVLPGVRKESPGIALWVGLAVAGGAVAVGAIGFWTVRRRRGDHAR